MEVAPVLVVLPLLWLTYRRYPLTPLLYTLILFHALILIFGGMYSYARVPLGFEVQQWLDLGRNPYDKLGHFFRIGAGAGGARDPAARRLCAGPQDAGLCGVLHRAGDQRRLRADRVVGGAGAGRAPTSFSAPGDPWDTQSDMFCALLGALCGLLLFAGWQDRQIRRLC